MFPLTSVVRPAVVVWLLCLRAGLYDWFANLRPSVMLVLQPHDQDSLIAVRAFRSLLSLLDEAPGSDLAGLATALVHVCITAHACTLFR